MLKRAPLLVLVWGLAVSAPTAAEVGRSRPGRDPNRRAVDKAQAETAARQILDDLMTSPEIAAAIGQSVGAPGAVCAVAAIPGPAASPDIRLTILNLVTDEIGFANVDSFFAWGGQSFVTDTVSSPTPPAGGTLTVEYPPSAGGGRGPAVLSFTGLGSLLWATFSLDPDTYDNPNYAASVVQMTGTLIEVAYDGGRRCWGTLAYNTTANAQVAILTQSSP
jgi:hypothetical protein